mgnify:CR=1 FL=1
MEKKENLKIQGHVGTWYVIDEGMYQGRKVFLLEHEEFGDTAPCLIVNENLHIVSTGGIKMDEVWNGLEELTY